jgi:hypothetical protein
LVLLEVATEPFSWFWKNLQKNPVLVKQLKSLAKSCCNCCSCCNCAPHTSCNNQTPKLATPNPHKQPQPNSRPRAASGIQRRSCSSSTPHACCNNYRQKPKEILEKLKKPVLEKQYKSSAKKSGCATV